MLSKIDKVKLVDPSLDEVLVVIAVVSIYDYLSAFKYKKNDKLRQKFHMIKLSIFMIIKLKILQGKLANLTLISVGVIVTTWVQKIIS